MQMSFIVRRTDVIKAITPIKSSLQPKLKLVAPISRPLATSGARKMSWVEWMIHCFKRWFHIARLTCLFSPLVISSPLLIVPGLKRIWWKYAVWAVKNSSAACMKFVQWASTRPDAFPREFCDKFGSFQAQAPCHSWKVTQQTLTESFGPDWESIFKLEIAPVGSGCVAQVYRGKLCETGESIAVKVIHPQVRHSIQRDLELMMTVAVFFEWICPELKWLSVHESIETFSTRMIEQLDLRIEAQNLIRFQKNFETTDGVFFPTPIVRYSNESVLVESFEEGMGISDIMHVPTLMNLEARHVIARTTVESFLKMIFLHNFAHGDLHPGNLVVRDGFTPSIVMLDAGITTQLSDQDLVNIIDLFHEIANSNGYAAARILLERSSVNQCHDESAFCSDMNDLVRDATGKHLQLNKVSVHEVMSRLLGLCLEHHVKLEARYASIVVAIGILEGVARTLNPAIDLLDIAFPIIAQSKLETTWRSLRDQQRSG